MNNTPKTEVTAYPLIAGQGKLRLGRVRYKWRGNRTSFLSTQTENSDDQLSRDGPREVLDVF